MLKTRIERELKQYLEDRRARIDRTLEVYLPTAMTVPERLHEAMRYSLFAGGKRIRPILAIAAFEAVSGEGRPPDTIDSILPVVASIELVHTYSLVHDDLPAMDDDDYRRGRLTSHKKFGEAAAILSGDALLSAAFALLSDRDLNRTIPPDILLSVIQELGLAAGSLGMVGGQFVDMESEGLIGSQTVSEETLRYVHSHKTGALIRAAVRIGALLGRAGTEALSSVTAYGEKAGLAFQVADDILDLEGTEKETGKRVRKDDAHRKLTYPTVVGLEASKRFADRLIREADEALASFGPEADPLRAIARFIVERKS
ncbi:MAG TPA: farnesyl diphosphate synthase [Nitrospiria bacterium]|jgi:geranylgeranyl diphosphate synthase type II|nr:farnesyl diphosphate synthase [Nitrospiria bacterium]